MYILKDPSLPTRPPQSSSPSFVLIFSVPLPDPNFPHPPDFESWFPTLRQRLQPRSSHGILPTHRQRSPSIHPKRQARIRLKHHTIVPKTSPCIPISAWSYMMFALPFAYMYDYALRRTIWGLGFAFLPALGEVMEEVGFWKGWRGEFFDWRG